MSTIDVLCLLGVALRWCGQLRTAFLFPKPKIFHAIFYVRNWYTRGSPRLLIHFFLARLTFVSST